MFKNVIKSSPEPIQKPFKRSVMRKQWVWGMVLLAKGCFWQSGTNLSIRSSLGSEREKRKKWGGRGRRRGRGRGKGREAWYPSQSGTQFWGRNACETTLDHTNPCKNRGSVFEQSERRKGQKNIGYCSETPDEWCTEIRQRLEEIKKGSWGEPLQLTWAANIG